MSEKERVNRRRQALIAAMAAGSGAALIEDEAEEMRLGALRLARIAWGRDRIAALKRAQKAADAAWMALVAPFNDRDEDEALPDLPPPPEQAVVEAILAEIHAVTEHDRWPRHLHWSL